MPSSLYQRAVFTCLLGGFMPWKYSVFHACAHILHILVLTRCPFTLPRCSSSPCSPFRSLIELAALEARLLISRKPLQGQCSHWFFVNCLQKRRLFPAFTGSNVLKPDFPVSTARPGLDDAGILCSSAPASPCLKNVHSKLAVRKSAIDILIEKSGKKK